MVHGPCGTNSYPIETIQPQRGHLSRAGTCCSWCLHSDILKFAKTSIHIRKLTFTRGIRAIVIFT